jgi:hypothetical protein
MQLRLFKAIAGSSLRLRIVIRAMNERFPSKPQGQVPDQDPDSNLGTKPRFSLPSESIGAPRLHSQHRMGLRN